MKQLVRTIGLALILGASPLLAQQPDAAQIRATLMENQQALREYLWQSRVEVEIDGKQNKVDLYQVRYNLGGELEKTRLGGEAQEKKQPRGPVRKRAAKKKQKGAAEFSQAVKTQLQAYMSTTGFGKILQNAFMRMGDGTIKLRSQDVAMEGDTVELEIVMETKQPMTMRVESTVDGEPVVMSITFQKLPDGPNYPARQIVDTQYAKKKLVITTENFDYSKVGG